MKRLVSLEQLFLTVKKYQSYLIACLLFCVLGYFIGVYRFQAPTKIAIGSNVTLPNFADLAEKVAPSVVNIRTTERIAYQAPDAFGNPFEDQSELLRRFFGIPFNHPKPNPHQPQEQQEKGVGSGFIISQDGQILTNAHVVDGADSIVVTLSNKKEYKAKVLGVDKRTDVAILKIDTNDLSPLTLGDSNSVRVGDWVMAVGSPFGLDNTVTAGIVSAKSRDTGEYLPFIQTDVAVNPGNSGGPLINTAGDVIGINSQIYSNSGGYMGISFAIPIDEAMKVVNQLRTTGHISRGRIGVEISKLSPEVADSIGLSKPMGAYVNKVESGSPADKGGILAGDVILKFDGKEIDKASDLPRIVGNTPAGMNVAIQVWRKGAVKSLNITVQNSDVDLTKASDKDSSPDSEPMFNSKLGMIVQDLSTKTKQKFHIQDGVQVVKIEDERISSIGIEIGDIIVRIGDVDIKDVKQFDQIVKSLDLKKSIPIFVRKSNSTVITVLKPQN
jgi:serine protease Do